MLYIISEPSWSSNCAVHSKIPLLPARGSLTPPGVIWKCRYHWLPLRRSVNDVMVQRGSAPGPKSPGVGVPSNRSEDVTPCFLQKSWVPWCQYCPSGWWQEFWFTLPSSGSSGTTMRLRVTWCSSPPAVQSWLTSCEPLFIFPYVIVRFCFNG